MGGDSLTRNLKFIEIINFVLLKGQIPFCSSLLYIFLNRIFTIICLLLSQTLLSQEVVRIEFQKGSPGDYDLLIRDILDQNGYKATVNYNKLDSNYLGKTIRYEAQHRGNYDQLHKLSLKLYEKGRLVKEYDKTISYFNAGVSDSKKFIEALRTLFDRKFEYNKVNERKKEEYFGISFNVLKVDSAKYLMVAKGAAIQSAKDVEEAFLKKAEQYLSGFDYFTEHQTYSYSYQYVRYKANMVLGIIIGNNTTDIKTKLAERPVLNNSAN